MSTETSSLSPALDAGRLDARPMSPRALAKAPVLAWRDLLSRAPSVLPTVNDLPHRAYTTSGRAGLLAALRQLALPADSVALVSSYHCPTMVAPVLHAGLVPAFFPIDADGLPLLEGISDSVARTARVMFVAHYFGLPRSLARVQAWCRSRGIALVEDCAHSYFGQAGELPVGQWGDYAVASLSKFFPVAEGGLLASAHHALQPLKLQAPGWRAQVKSGVDVLEFAHRHHQLAGLRHAAAPMFWLKNRGRTAARCTIGNADLPNDAATLTAGADMGRVLQAPAIATRLLHRSLSTGSIAQKRRDNYLALHARLAQAPGARPLFPGLPVGAVPYVWPLWVDGAARADAVYARLRAAQMPAFRWDRIWPGTPADPQDNGPLWSRHVLQLLCHQSLHDDDIAQVADTTTRILQDC